MDATNHILLAANLLIYTITFILYQRKHDYLSTGSLYLLYTIFTCILAWICFATPNSFYRFNDLTLFPFIYLYIGLMLFILPVLKFDEKHTELIQPTHRAFDLLCIFVILMGLIQVVDVVHSFQEGIGSMIWDIRSGAELYSDTRSNADTSGEGISNIYAIIGGSFSHLVILFAFIHLTRDKINYLIVAGLLLCFAIDLMASIANGSRGNTVLKCITVVFAFWLTRHWMQQHIRRRIGALLIGIIIAVSIPIIMITIGRFSDRSSMDKAASNSIIYYSGQSMLNFDNYCLNAGGIRYGDRTANLLKRIYDPSTPKNYIQRRAKYSNLKIDDYYFYTHVGDFTLDYGPLWGMVIIIALTILFIALTKTNEGKIPFHKLIILYFVLCINCQGLMYLFSFSDTGGGLQIITTILSYFYFKFNYMHSRQLIKI